MEKNINQPNSTDAQEGQAKPCLICGAENEKDSAICEKCWQEAKPSKPLQSKILIKVDFHYLQIIGGVIIIAALIVAIWYGLSTRTPDAEYLAKSIRYPSLYPAYETPYLFNKAGFLLIWLSGSIGGLLLIGMGEIVKASKILTKKE